MFKIVALPLILYVISTPVDKTTLTEKEREYLLNYMVKTRERLLKDVTGLTVTQLNLKPDSSRWSVAECLEHITIAV